MMSTESFMSIEIEDVDIEGDWKDCTYHIEVICSFTRLLFRTLTNHTQSFISMTRGLSATMKRLMGQTLLSHHVTGLHVK